MLICSVENHRIASLLLLSGFTFISSEVCLKILLQIKIAFPSGSYMAVGILDLGLSVLEGLLCSAALELFSPKLS